MDKEQIKEKLKEVKDPELGIDIVTLGLVRDISIDDESKTGVSGVEVLMTLTTPFCPFAEDLIAEVENSLEAMGFENARVELTFEPPWEPSEELRMQLGI